VCQIEILENIDFLNIDSKGLNGALAVNVIDDDTDKHSQWTSAQVDSGQCSDCQF
jgi:hypothetical protein